MDGFNTALDGNDHELSARHSGEGRNPVKSVVRSTQNLYVVCCARHFWLDSGFRRNDEREA